MGGRDPDVCRLIVLGSTGSIGTQTLEVVEHLNGLHARGAWGTRYEVVGLAGGRNSELLGAQATKFGVCDRALGGLSLELVSECEETRWPSRGRAVTTRFGADAGERMVRHVECDLVVAAMSGAAGLPATLAAVELGRDVALANKETLVAAGELVVAAAEKSGAKLLPVDSEHSGVWQGLAGEGRLEERQQGSLASRHQGGGASGHRGGAPPMRVPECVKRVVLTASGGPFRTWTKEQMERATPEQALKHPTWSMGRKVTIDSASLMNKALEVVEAHWLFGLSPEKIEVVVHPQSVVHAMVEFADGSMVAQLAAPDMRTPIQHALTWPRRGAGVSRRLDWAAMARLEFEPVEGSRFPAVGLAYRAIRDGGAAGAVLNGANEAAVEAFLAGRIAFTRIAELAERAMDRAGGRSSRVASLGDVLEADRRAREFVAGEIAHGP